MRILIACPTLGINSEVWILRQIDGLVRLGHEVSVLCWQHDGYTPEDYTDRPVTVLPYGLSGATGFKRWIDRAKNALGRNFVRGSAGEEDSISERLGQQRPDVILCHFGFVAMRVLPVAQRLGIPVAAHFHGLDLSSMLKMRWYRWSLQSQVKKFDHAIVVGSHQAQILRDQGVDENALSLIPCGVPTEQFQPVSRPARDHVRFIQVSRVVPWKGVEQGIRAFAKVNPQLPDSRLVIVGDGVQLEEMKQLVAELGLEHAVEFTGAIPPDRVVQQLQSSDVFIHHSLTYHTGWCEGFGVSIAEAAAMSLPLVVTRSGGIPDQVIDQQTGFLVEERDVDAMVQAMLKLAGSAELREQLGQAGRQRMIEHFDSAGQIAKLEGVVRNAAGDRHAEA